LIFQIIYYFKIPINYNKLETELFNNLTDFKNLYNPKYIKIIRIMKKDLFDDYNESIKQYTSYNCISLNMAKGILLLFYPIFLIPLIIDLNISCCPNCCCDRDCIDNEF
jgi:hypothetical protein